MLCLLFRLLGTQLACRIGEHMMRKERNMAENVLNFPKPVKEESFLKLLWELTPAERAMLGTVLKQGAELANRECTDYATVLDALTMATLAEPYTRRQIVL